MRYAIIVQAIADTCKVRVTSDRVNVICYLTSRHHWGSVISLVNTRDCDIPTIPRLPLLGGFQKFCPNLLRHVLEGLLRNDRLYPDIGGI